MKTNRFSILLIVIILIAAFLRLWRLGINPPQLSPDEAALGYNAYSILKTGHDEYGKFLPLIFKSFGDWKPGLYVYSAVPSIAVLGLNEFAVRLPSAIAGIFAVWLIYLIVKELEKEKNSDTYEYKLLPYISALFLALSPWHIHFSRGAWEINLALTLTLAGIYFFLKSFNKSKYLVASSVFFGLTFITYQGAKLSTILVLLVLIAVYWTQALKLFRGSRRVITASFIVGLIITTPIILSLFEGKTGRLKVFSVLSYPRKSEDLVNFLREGNEKVNGVKYYLFHSETLNFARGVLGRYYNHFSGRFLFFEGDYQNPKQSIPNSGMLLLSDLIFIVSGFVFLIKRGGRFLKFVVFWLLISPLPAVLTRDQVQSVRAYNMVVPLTLLSAAGFVYLTNYLRRKGYVLNLLGYFFLTIVISGSLIYFFDSYFIHLPIHDAKYWNYGYKQVVNLAIPIQNNYEKIIFQQSYNQPYIYFLFYGAAKGNQLYQPQNYQKVAKITDSPYGDVGLVENLGNITFRGFSWPYATGEKGTLLIGNSVAIPPEYSKKDYSLLYEVKYPDNFETAFRVLEVK